MTDRPRDVRELEVLTDRLGVLSRLCAGPAHKRDLVADLDQSRRTIDRAVNDLAEFDLVERGDDGFVATTAGRLAVDLLAGFQGEFADVLAARAVLDPLPFDAPVAVDVVAGGEALPADDPVAHRPLERFHDALADAERYRALLPALDDPRHVRLLYEHVVTAGDPADLVAAPALFGALRSEFPRRTAAMAEEDGFRTLVGDVPPFGLVLLDGPDGEQTVYLVVFVEEGNGVHGVLVNGTPAAVRWAERRFAAAVDDAEDRTDGLHPDPAGDRAVDPDGGAVGAVAGGRLPVALDREGFVRLDREYFREEPVADPATAWRAGLTVPEVHTGYAVERTLEADGDDGHRNMTPTLADDLAAGQDRVVVGPPGSGKSTVCKRVACEWYDADRGPVLYRECGRGRPFQSVDDLVVAVDAADGHALVVVEDAVRSSADAVFDAIDRLGDRDDVSFLLDARETEWSDPPGDPREVPDLAVHSMPPLSDADAERIVAHFERTAGETVDVPADGLRESVREAATTDDAAADEVLLLLHRLATFADPLTDERTSLEDAVAALYEDVVDTDLALDVCVLANALNAAGLDVDRAALLAVVDEAAGADDVVDDGGRNGDAERGGEADRDAFAAALAHLEGRVLFPDDGGYRTVHESWSVAFLDHLLSAMGDERAAERFGDCVSAFLALADDPEGRARVAGRAGESASLAGLADDPGRWADDVVTSLYALARERPKLARLFGDGATDSVSLPAASDPETVADRPAWLGRAFADAGWFDAAQRAFERLPDDGSERAFERRFGLSRVAEHRGEYDAAVAHAEACRSLADALADETCRARADLRLGRVLTAREEYEAADQPLQRALDGFDALDDRRRTAATLDALGTVARRLSEFETAESYHRRSLELNRALGDRRGEARSCRHLGSVALDRTAFDAARKHYARSLDLFRYLGDRDAVAAVLENLGLVARHQGEYDAAREYHTRSLAVSEELGDAHGEARSLGNLGLLAKKRDDYDAAVDYYERTLDLHRELGLRHGEAKACCNIAEVAVQRGDAETAREYVERSDAVFADLGDGKGRAITANIRGAAAREEGDLDGACEAFRRSVDLFDEVGIPQGRAVARRNLGEVLARRGDREVARDELQRALDTFEGIGAPQDALETLEHLVGACREDGDREAAERWCRRARESLVDAPDAIADEHREWVEDAQAARDDG